MKQQYKRLVMIAFALIITLQFVRADNPFLPNFIEDPITKSLEAIQIFTYDFLSIIMDIFTVILFLLWLGIIASIIYGIVYIINLPKQFGASNFQDIVINITKKLWDFIK